MTGAVIAISIVLIVFAAAAAITLSYYRLQRHRSDAVALAGYRRLAEEAAAHELLVTREQLAVEIAQDEADGHLLLVAHGRPRVHEAGTAVGRLG